MAVKHKVDSGGTVTEKVETAPIFTIEKMQENCRELFGVSTATFVGATYGMKGRYTVEEMKKRINEWKREGVK